MMLDGLAVAPMMRSGDYLVVEDAVDKQAQIRDGLSGLLIDTRYTDFFGVNVTSAWNGVLTRR
jgi:cephalosporin hydroxylase